MGRDCIFSAGPFPRAGAGAIAVALGALFIYSGCDGDCERRSLVTIDADVLVSGLSIDVTGLSIDENSLPDPYFRVRLLGLTNAGDGKSLNSPVEENTEQVGPVSVSGSFTTRTYGVGFRVVVFDADSQSDDDEICRTPDIRTTFPNPDDEPDDITRDIVVNCSSDNNVYPLDIQVVFSNLKAGYKTGVESCPYEKCTTEKVNIADVRLSGFGYTLGVPPDDASEGLRGDLFLETIMETEALFQGERKVLTEVIEDAPDAGTFPESYDFFGTRFYDYIDFDFSLEDEDAFSDDILGEFSFSVHTDDMEKPDYSVTFQDTDTYDGETATGTSSISVDIDFLNIRSFKDEICPIQE